MGKMKPEYEKRHIQFLIRELEYRAVSYQMRSAKYAAEARSKRLSVKTSVLSKHKAALKSSYYYSLKARHALYTLLTLKKKYEALNV